jgi:hypothetical protein
MYNKNVELIFLADRAGAGGPLAYRGTFDAVNSHSLTTYFFAFGWGAASVGFADVQAFAEVCLDTDTITFYRGGRITFLRQEEFNVSRVHQSSGNTSSRRHEKYR